MDKDRGKSGRGAGRRSDNVVRKRLADGTIKEYRYSREPGSRARHVPEQNAMRALAVAYVGSPEFKKLSATWQSAKRYYLGIIEDELAWMTKADLNGRECRGDFYEMRDKFGDTPHKADKLTDTLKGLLGWAYERGKLEYNHALGLKHLAGSKGTRSEIVWTEDHEAIVLSTFPASLQQAFRFSMFAAIRQADLCALRWEQYRDGWLTFRPGKTKETTGIKIHLPVFALPPFKALIDELSRGTEYMLTSENGQPWKTENLRARWRYTFAKSAMKDEDLHWHDIRGSALTRMAEAGCTDAERAAISGHAFGGGSKLGDYTARSKQLALNAYTKWGRYIAEGPTVIDLQTARTTGAN